VLRVIDYAIKRMLTVEKDTYITATEAHEMLQKISTEYANRVVHIVLDNAKYQKCDAVRSRVADFEITLQYIPPYNQT